jgi:SAM-dependent methyltransferase
VSLPAVAEANPWAFWAPTPDEFVERALDLAEVRPGTRFLDLGCGDGRVLVSAARRGAEVCGMEINPRMAEVARANLQAAGVAGRVDVVDMFTASIDADVVYAYLTPVTLSLLRAGLARARPGTRIVTPRYGIAGWAPSAVEGGSYLYSLPAQAEEAPAQLGWNCRAVILVLPADRVVLSPLTLAAGCEPLVFEFDPPLARACDHAIGCRPHDRPAHVPVDLMFKPHGVGSVIAGEISAQGREVTVAAVFARQGFGHWKFDSTQGPQFRARLDQVIAAARAGQ